MVTVLTIISPSLTWPQKFDFSMANRVSRNFTIEELTASTVAIRNGLSNKPPQKALIAITTLAQQVLQPVRNQFGPVKVNSCYRTPEVNQLIGGSSKSSHCCAEDDHGNVTKSAADIEVFDIKVSNLELAQWIRDNLKFSQLILEFYHEEKGPHSGWVHVSYDLTGENNNEVLTASLVNGAVKYTPGLPE
jgi:zinc D-Ala-D-Ala carboxypeptidase